MRTRTIFSWLAFCSLVACAGGLPQPTASDAARLGARWPDVALGDLEQGRELYAGRCSKCHELYEPRRFSAERWQTEVKEMRVRAHLSERQELRIVQYLVSVAERPLTATSQEDPEEN